MQATETNTELLTALPKPLAKVPLKAPKKKIRISASRFLKVICFTVALGVMLMCAYEKLNTAFEKGLLNYISEELLCLSESPTLGDSVSLVAFGNAGSIDVSEHKNALTLPKIFYIPKENIIKKIEEDKFQNELKAEELYQYDLSEIPEGFFPIIPVDVSEDDVLNLKNDTSFKIDMAQVIAKPQNFVAPLSKDPLVLIVHTHGTESFSDLKKPYYNEKFNHPRSENVSENVVAVGKTICDALNEKGIPTIHCEVMHDKESYISAYERSAESIRYYLEKYPSIQYVFDVHRDSLIRSDLTKLRPVTLRGGKASAQIMIIVGSDEKGSGDYNWEGNLALAASIWQSLGEDEKTLSRQLYLRGASYNQQYAKYGLLLEIGSCGNSLEEAKEAARAFADAFGKTIENKND